jgi:hypothetical protein
MTRHANPESTGAALALSDTFSPNGDSVKNSAGRRYNSLVPRAWAARQGYGTQYRPIS